MDHYADKAGLNDDGESLCDEHGIVMIADEVQSGFARTGKLLPWIITPIRPDLMTMAKA
ncbi:hypothetical protein CBL27_27500, partial [Shigella sonnei]